jgi:preprotein translocase subunit SecB
MAEEQAQRQVLLQKIYLKDASLEVPMAPEVFTRQWKPTVDVNLSTQSKAMQDDLHHVMLTVTVTAKLEEDVAFLVEVHQAGIFLVRGFPDAREKQAVIGAYCPSILFPYAREAVSDIATRGGFPQILLQPVNFDALFQEHLARQQQAGAPAEATVPAADGTH